MFSSAGRTRTHIGKRQLLGINLQQMGSAEFNSESYLMDSPFGAFIVNQPNGYNKNTILIKACRLTHKHNRIEAKFLLARMGARIVGWLGLQQRAVSPLALLP